MRRSTLFPVLALVPVLSLFAARSAAAQPLGGALTGVGLLGSEEHGGAGLVDLYAEFGALRLGGGFGVAAVSDAADTHSRVFAPFGFSAALLFGSRRGAAIELRGRFGAWAGATDTGLGSGVWGSAGAWLRIGLGARAGILFGLDAWFQSAVATPVYFAPGIGFGWTS